MVNNDILATQGDLSMIFTHDYIMWKSLVNQQTHTKKKSLYTATHYSIYVLVMCPDGDPGIFMELWSSLVLGGQVIMTWCPSGYIKYSLVQDCCISNALALEILQSCTKPLM